MSVLSRFWPLLSMLCMGMLASDLQAESPNILFAIADDWSYGHAGAYGCPWVETPAFDQCFLLFVCVVRAGNAGLGRRFGIACMFDVLFFCCVIVAHGDALPVLVVSVLPRSMKGGG